MRTRTTFRGVAGITCAALLTLTACGSGNGTSNDAGKSPKSPLATYLGEDGGMGGPIAMGPGGRAAFAVTTTGSGGALHVAGPSESSAKERGRQRKVEELTAECMRGEGFEYIPYIPEKRPKSEWEKAYELPPEKFAEQYGYGISTLMFGGEKPSDVDKNPNDEIRDALTPKAKKAYSKALYGDMSELVVDDDGTGQSSVRVEAAKPGKPGKPMKLGGEDTGCQGKAAEKVFGKPESMDEIFKQRQKFDGLFKDIEALRKRIERDPKYVEASKAWSDCMAGKKYTGLQKPDEATGKVHKKMESVWMADKPDRSKLPGIRKYEMALAKADFACRKEHWTTTVDKIRYEHEKTFVDDHKNELVRYRDWRTEAEKAGR